MNNNLSFLKVVDFLKTIVSEDEITYDNADVISPRIIQIYLPKYKFAMNIDSLDQTNCPYKDMGKKNHQDISALCAKNNISLLALFEDEVSSKWELIQHMILYRLKMSKAVRLRAEDLELRKLNKNKEFKDFFNKYHLDNSTNASFAWGLFYKDELVSCMSFRMSFANKSLEIARFASNYNYITHGSASRLLSNIKQELVTYSNNRLSVGNVYKALGFKEITVTNQPSYYYTNGKIRLWRFKCKRVNIPEIIAQYPTETLQALGGVFSRMHLGNDDPLYKIFDYGHRKWIKKETTEEDVVLEHTIKDNIDNKRLKEKTISAIRPKYNISCPNGHKLQSKLDKNEQERYCPYCVSDMEKVCRKLFEKLTNHKFKISNPNSLTNPMSKTQLQLDGYNEELKLAFEYDGEYHYLNKENHIKKKEDRDRLKDELCKKNGIRLIRIPFYIKNKADFIKNSINELLIDNSVK